MADHFRSRKNDANVTTADVLQGLRDGAGESIGRGDAVDALKKLAAAGCGDFKVGRGQQKTRLIWAKSPQAIFNGKAPGINMNAANGGIEEPTLKGEDLTPSADRAQFLQFPFPLRQDHIVHLEVPSDLTEDERKRLSDAILTLPVKSST